MHANRVIRNSNRSDCHRGPKIETFRGATEPFQPDIPLWTRPPSEHLPPRPDSDLISPDSGPGIRLFRSKSGPNQVRIRSRARCLEGGRGQRGRSGWMALQLWESFYPKTHPKSRNTKKTPPFTQTLLKVRGALYLKVRANFCLLPCDTSQESNGNRWDELVQMNFFILGGFYSGDFPSVMQLKNASDSNRTSDSNRGDNSC